MANLKEELDEYLSSKHSDSKPLLDGISIPVSVSMPKVGSWFKRNDHSEEAENWFSAAQKDYCPSLSRIQRIVGFCICVCMGFLCFTFAALNPLRARKFALLYTMGSLFLICSFSFLWGPIYHLKHLFSKERLCFTLSYLGSLFSTLYFALVQQSTPFTVLCAVIQVITLLWFLISYIPGGHTGLMFFTKLFSSAVASSVSKSLPV